MAYTVALFRSSYFFKNQFRVFKNRSQSVKDTRKHSNSLNKYTQKIKIETLKYRIVKTIEV